MAKTLTAFRRERGVTLVELMIAMGLSLLIGLAVIEVFLSQRQLFVAQDEQSRMQENARFVFEQVSRDLRMVGYWGCSNKVTIANTTGNDAYSDLSDKAVRLTTGVLTVRYLNTGTRKLIGSDNTVVLDDLQPPLLAAGCTSATLFGNSTSKVLPAGYYSGGEVFQLDTVTYQRTDAGQIERNGEVLVDKGVNAFDFEFGVGTGDYVDSYKAGSDVAEAEWANVKSVKMTLTLSSEHVKARDFVSVIAIRNRLP